MCCLGIVRCSPGLAETVIVLSSRFSAPTRARISVRLHVLAKVVKRRALH
jgi:hypothetical protein